MTCVSGSDLKAINWSRSDVSKAKLLWRISMLNDQSTLSIFDGAHHTSVILLSLPEIKVRGHINYSTCIRTKRREFNCSINLKGSTRKAARIQWVWGSYKVAKPQLSLFILGFGEIHTTYSPHPVGLFDALMNFSEHHRPVKYLFVRVCRASISIPSSKLFIIDS